MPQGAAPDSSGPSDRLADRQLADTVYDGSGVADSCEIAAGIRQDCDEDGVPDGCEEDCNGNQLPDDCEAVPVLAGSSVDFDGVDDTIALAKHGLNFSGTITMEAWIRQEATDGIRLILCHGSPFSPKGTGLFTQERRSSTNPCASSPSVPA